MIPAEAVATSIAVGPDGAYYVGELKGFPAPTGASKIWRIKPHARHAECGTSPDCTVIADGFTSIVDLSFGWDGTLHVVELDEASWFAVENGTPTAGTVTACKRQLRTGTWTCDVEAAGLFMPMAATVDFRGRVHVVTSALVPGAAEVITLQWEESSSAKRLPHEPTLSPVRGFALGAGLVTSVAGTAHIPAAMQDHGRIYCFTRNPSTGALVETSAGRSGKEGRTRSPARLNRADRGDRQAHGVQIDHAIVAVHVKGFRTATPVGS
jgi:hypothetical protein